MFGVVLYMHVYECQLSNAFVCADCALFNAVCVRECKDVGVGEIIPFSVSCAYEAMSSSMSWVFDRLIVDRFSLLPMDQRDDTTQN